MAKKSGNAGSSKEQGKINDLLGQAGGLMDTFGIKGEQAQKVIEQIASGQIKNNQNLVEELKLLKKINKQLERKDDLLSAMGTKRMGDRDLTKEINKLVSKETDMANNLLDYNKAKKKEFLAQVFAMRKQVMASASQKDITFQQKKLYMEQLTVIEDQMRMSEKFSAKTEAAMDMLNDGLNKATGFMDGFINKIPGGKYLSKALGLDETGELLKKGMNKGMSTFVTQVGKGTGKMKALSMAGRAAAASIGPQGLIVLGIAAAVAAVALLVAAVYGVFKALSKVTELSKEFAKETGMSVNQSKILVEQSYDLHASSENFLATQQEILGVQKQMIDMYGRADMISGQTAVKVANIGKAFGYGSQVAAEVQSKLMTIGGASEETAANMQIMANKMGEAMGVAPGKIMKDLAKNGGLLAKSMAGNAKEMVKTAAYAASIGLDIDSMVKATDTLLDIESSLTSQMEYQAISGNQINMEKARYLKAIGDEAGAMKEMTKQLKMQGDISKMSPIAREKLAKTMGLEVGELMKINKLNKLQVGMSKEQKALIDKYGDSLGDISDKNADQVLQMASQAQMVDRISMMWNKLKSMFMSALKPFMDIMGMWIEDSSKGMDMMGSIINAVIIMPFKLLGKLLKTIYTSAIQPLIKAFDPLREAFSEIFDKSAKNGEKTFGKITDIIGNVLSPIFNAIGFVIKNFIVRPVAALVKVFGVIFDVVSVILGAFLDLGNVLTTVIMAPLNIVFTVLGGIADFIWDGIVGAFTYVGDMIASIGTSITDFFMAPIRMVKDAIRGMLPGWALKLLGMGADSAESSQAAESSGMPSGGSVDDGVIQDGKIISTNPADTIIATKEPSSLLSGIGGAAQSVMSASPMGMLASGIGSLFGGGESGGAKDQVLADLAQAIKDLQSAPLTAVVSAEQASSAVNTANSYKTGP